MAYPTPLRYCRPSLGNGLDKRWISFAEIPIEFVLIHGRYDRDRVPIAFNDDFLALSLPKQLFGR